MEAGHDRARREGDSDFTSFLKSQQNIVTPTKRRTLKGGSPFVCGYFDNS